MLYLLFRLYPKTLASHLFGYCTRRRWPLGLHRFFKHWFIRHYRVDLTEAEFPVGKYATLGDFFIRHLKPGARPIAAAEVVSPVDGVLTQMGRLQGDRPVLTQIKGKEYSLPDLLGPDWDWSPYRDGGYFTIYLAPFNYHRIHAPIRGQVTRAAYVPGSLWPVNTWSVGRVQDLFVINERIAVELAGEGGSAIVVMVGATNVGRITLDFHAGMVGNAIPKVRERVWRPPQPLVLDKGQGLGCFELGSTVILILSRPLFEKMDAKFGTPAELRMGQALAALPPARERSSP